MMHEEIPGEADAAQRGHSIGVHDRTDRGKESATERDRQSNHDGLTQVWAVQTTMGADKNRL